MITERAVFPIKEFKENLKTLNYQKFKEVFEFCQKIMIIFCMFWFSVW